MLIFLRPFKIHFKSINGWCRILTVQVVRTVFMKRCLSCRVLDFQTTIQMTLNAIGFSSWTCHSLMLSLPLIPFTWRHLMADRTARKSAWAYGLVCALSVRRRFFSSLVNNPRFHFVNVFEDLRNYRMWVEEPLDAKGSSDIELWIEFLWLYDFLALPYWTASHKKTTFPETKWSDEERLLYHFAFSFLKITLNE